MWTNWEDLQSHKRFPLLIYHLQHGDDGALIIFFILFFDYYLFILIKFYLHVNVMAIANVIANVIANFNVISLIFILIMVIFFEKLEFVR
jgi:hypothetical protein